MVNPNPNEELNQEEEISLDNKELSQEEIKQLLKKVIEEGSHEAKFILQLAEWRRPGSSFVDYGEIEILYGEIEKIELDSIYNYPTTDKTQYAIIPKTRTVIILFKSGNDYEGKMQRSAELHVFTYPKGWIKLELY